MAMFLFLFVSIGALVVCGAVAMAETLINRKKSGWYQGNI